MGRYWYQKSWAKCEEVLGSSRRLTQIVLVVGTLLPLVLLCWLWEGSRTPAAASLSAGTGLPTGKSSSLPTSPAELGARVRRLLPYSVIPGGVLDADELKAALANDSLAAAHYSGFDAAKAHVVRLDRDRLVYVSYRLNNHIYWTTKRLTLLKGETVLTDGEHEARTRCGNRISDTPRQPVSLKEPEHAALENPQLPMLAAPVADDWSFPLADLFPPPPLGPLAAEAVPPGDGGWIFVPPVLPVGGSRTPGTPAVPAVPLSPVLPPPAATPEPASLLLVSSGLLGLWLRRGRSRK